jgi:hypothetical protein
MKIEITIPRYFENVENENELLFLAYLYKLGLTYGNKNIFKLYNTDIRSILGIEGYFPHIYIQEREWSKWIDMADVAEDAYGYRIKLVRGQGKDANTVTKTLTDERCVMVWIYLLGCFNNNLVEQEGHKTRKGLYGKYKRILTNGFDF